jgi:PIN domain nuclease of toxin-antitoxin system
VLDGICNPKRLFPFYLDQSDLVTCVKANQHQQNDFTSTAARKSIDRQKSTTLTFSVISFFETNTKKGF